jgi:hypothetical protein
MHFNSVSLSVPIPISVVNIHISSKPFQSSSPFIFRFTVATSSSSKEISVFSTSFAYEWSTKDKRSTTECLRIFQGPRRGMHILSMHVIMSSSCCSEKIVCVGSRTRYRAKAGPGLVKKIADLTIFNQSKGKSGSYAQAARVGIEDLTIFNQSKGKRQISSSPHFFKII